MINYFSTLPREIEEAAQVDGCGRLKILWRMWQERQPYDENRHALNQQKHGSWVLQFQPKAA